MPIGVIAASTTSTTSTTSSSFRGHIVVRLIRRLVAWLIGTLVAACTAIAMRAIVQRLAGPEAEAEGGVDPLSKLWPAGAAAPWARRSRERDEGGRRGKWQVRSIDPKHQRIALGCLESFAEETRATSALDDIGGLRQLKQELTTGVLTPLRHPHVFFSDDAPNILAPARRVLLAGPPGTGKTMMARALAVDARADFIHVTLGTVEDKFFGESPKILRALFALARERAAVRPTILFFDELDGLMRKRRDDDQAATYGLKTEVLQLLDGLQATDRVVVVGCTNHAAQLDPALVRRFGSVHEVGLPDAADRHDIWRLLLRDRDAPSAAQLDGLVRATHGWSGSRIRDAYDAASRARLRRFLHGADIGPDTTALSLADRLPPLCDADWGAARLLVKDGDGGNGEEVGPTAVEDDEDDEALPPLN